MRRALLPLGSALLMVLDSAAGTGLLVADAAAEVIRRNDGHPAPLIIAPTRTKAMRQARGHRSHSSHSSHSSHYSGGGGGYSSGGYSSGGSYSGSYEPAMTPPSPPEPPPPPPPKLARVSIVAIPGGQIFVDGNPHGHDATETLVLKPGRYVVKVANRFIGEHMKTIDVGDGQTGVITIDW